MFQKKDLNVPLISVYDPMIDLPNSLKLKRRKKQKMKEELKAKPANPLFVTL